MPAGSLQTYRKKRNFRHTPEPKGDGKKARRKKPIFVIQKHAARQLHYDLRPPGGARTEVLGGAERAVAKSKRQAYGC